MHDFFPFFIIASNIFVSMTKIASVPKRNTHLHIVMHHTQNRMRETTNDEKKTVNIISVPCISIHLLCINVSLIDVIHAIKEFRWQEIERKICFNQICGQNRFSNSPFCNFWTDWKSNYWIQKYAVRRNHFAAWNFRLAVSWKKNCSHVVWMAHLRNKLQLSFLQLFDRKRAANAKKHSTFSPRCWELW